MKVLDVDALQNGIDEILSKLSTQSKQVQDVQTAITGVTALKDSSFTGIGGQAILSFYEREHLSFLSNYQIFLQEYTTKLHHMKLALSELEPANIGIIHQSYLENEVESGLNVINHLTMRMTQVGNGHIQSVADLVSLPRLRDDKVLQQIENAKRNKQDTSEKLSEFDYDQTKELEPIDQKLETLTQKIHAIESIFESKIVPVNPHLKTIDHRVDTDEFIIKKPEEREWYDAIGDVIIGILEGLWDTIVDIVVGLLETLFELISNPIEFFVSIYTAITNPIDTFNAIKAMVMEAWNDQVVNGDLRSRTRFFTYVIANGALTVFTAGVGGGVKGVSTVPKTLKAVKEAGEAGEAATVKSDLPVNVMTTDKVNEMLENKVREEIQTNNDRISSILQSDLGKRTIAQKITALRNANILNKIKNTINSKKLIAAIQAGKTRTIENLHKGKVLIDQKIDDMKNIQLFPEPAFAAIPGDVPVSKINKVDNREYRKIDGDRDESTGEADKTYLKNIDEFISGNKKFDEVLDDFARHYVEIIEIKNWSWANNIQGGNKLTSNNRKMIKQRAEELGLIPKVEVKKVEGMRYGFADFEEAGVVVHKDELPKELWLKGDLDQFNWLNNRLPEEIRLMVENGSYTWHHTEIPGKMQLIPYGIHGITVHNGGRTTGMWADAPR